MDPSIILIVVPFVLVIYGIWRLVDKIFFQKKRDAKKQAEKERQKEREEGIWREKTEKFFNSDSFKRLANDIANDICIRFEPNRYSKFDFVISHQSTERKYNSVRDCYYYDSGLFLIIADRSYSTKVDYYLCDRKLIEYNLGNYDCPYGVAKYVGFSTVVEKLEPLLREILKDKNKFLEVKLDKVEFRCRRVVGDVIVVSY